MALNTMRLVDWLDDLCVRFIINLPVEELSSVERICFQIEEAQWFYEDFIRPLDPTLPSLHLRIFCMAMLRHCPLTAPYPEAHEDAYQNWIAYKTRVPVRGAIMLNQDMTKVILVKGWKKNAKWSFPRGKINKGEKDLTCAVREVWEETGLDLNEIPNMVPPENEEDRLKKISVSMREQDMVLYVFRGVPEDTYFEPRTRKEISKIDWYNLADLPTIKRKNQRQQGMENDMIESNNFYMVAPFIGSLRAWIHREHKRERQMQNAGAKGTRRIQSGVTDTEDIDAGDTTADDAPPPETQQVEESSPQNDDNLASLLANLGRGHRSSDALPEVSAQQAPPQIDPAAELKRLLSVGGELPAQTPPVEAPAPAQDPRHNEQMAMLHANNRPPPPLTDSFLYRSTPPDGSNFGQHRQNPPYPQHPSNVSHMPPPPPFNYQQQQPSFRGPHPNQVPNQVPQQHPQGTPMQMPLHFLPPPPRQHTPTFPTHAPHIHPTFTPDNNSRPYQRTGDPQFARPPGIQGAHGPVIPPASKLPLPKLTPHALGLLNAFKVPERASPVPAPASQPTPSSYTTPRMQPPPALHREVESFASVSALSSAHPYAPSPPPFQSPPPNGNPQPMQQPKPRSAHQDSLLKLFAPPSVSASPPPSKDAEPVELSAYPKTPGHMALQPPSHEAGPPMPDMSRKPYVAQAVGVPAQKQDLTSATVSGPVNVPDFETVKKHKHHVDGHSRGPSPAQPRSVEQKPFAPQILKRDPALSKSRSPRPVEVDGSKNASMPGAPSPAPVAAPAPSQQQQKPAPMKILKRPQPGATPTIAALSPVPLPIRPVVPPEDKRTLVPSDGPVHVPSVPVPRPGAVPAPGAPGFDRRETAAAEQKNTLLSLFGKAGVPAPAGSRSPARPPQALPTALSKSPLPKSPQPPTPRSVVSGIISPVSPLPDKSSQVNSPAQAASRSRISSIGEAMPPSISMVEENMNTASVVSASASLPGVQRNGQHLQNGHVGAEEGAKDAALGVTENGNGKAKVLVPATSPVDATFLRGFLEGVARRGR